MGLCTEDLIGPGGELIYIKGSQLVHCSVEALTCVHCYKKLVFRVWFDGSQSYKKAANQMGRNDFPYKVII